MNVPEGRQLRKAIRNIRRTLPDILHILILFLANVALFSLLCLKLFEERGLSYPDGKPYFQDYWDSYWDLYVLVTTANNPDVKMPAYDASRWYVTVFIIYMLINLYVIMNIVLAVIYNSYKRHLKVTAQA
ncbi:hypothetical protein LSH36_56g03051 [Paralvinella palmiformis]|uniref:Ion transport domain-containing protein n=1 Tax=Paralvinella palmiformis TaxID=53620 RepID=A0AAD9K4X0_9ANNE|nr:hypothetical protein LSH36_56g03051 [Paralvinella palmiformis]